MKEPHLLISPEYLAEHLTLQFPHWREGTSGFHRGNDYCGTLGTDPEAGSGGLGHLTANVVDANEISFDKLLPKDTHDVRIAFACERDCGTEILHKINAMQN